MYIIKIMTEFMHSPVWYCDENGIEFYNKKNCFETFYKDTELNEASHKFEELYTSFYHFDREEPCYFDKEAEKENKEYILLLLKIIKERLNALNNGEFTILDYWTEYYSSL